MTQPYDLEHSESKNDSTSQSSGKQGSYERYSLYPKWWTGLLILSLLVIFFGLPYYLITKPLPNPPVVKKNHLKKNTNQQESSIGLGKRIFQSKCSACHGALGEGGIGPNLTDQYWLHGHQANEILEMIQEGIPAKGMGAWKNILTPDEIISVRDYVLTLQGTHPPNPKGAQGQFIQE